MSESFVFVPVLTKTGEEKGKGREGRKQRKRNMRKECVKKGKKKGSEFLIVH